MTRTRETIVRLLAMLLIGACVTGVFVSVLPMSMTVPVQAAQKYTLKEYRSNAIKSFGKTYDKLLKKNEYSAFGKQQLKLLKEIGENAINEAKSKTKIKEAKTAAIEDFNSIITLPDETRNAVIAFLKGDKSIKKSKRTKAIKKLEGMTNVTDMLSLSAKYGYEQTDRVTIEQIEARIKLLGKKYKAYTEDEIRCLVATANLDYIDDSDVYKAFNVKNDNELKAKADLFDRLMDDEYDNMGDEWLYLYDHSRYIEANENYMKKSIKYDDMVKFNELFINSKIKGYADQLFDLTDLMVKKNNTKLTGETITEGVHAGCELGYYIFRTDEYKKYCEPLLYDFGDARLKGTSAEYVINKYICMASYHLSTTHRVKVCIPEDYKYQLSNYIDTLENPILKLTNIKVKTK